MILTDHQSLNPDIEEISKWLIDELERIIIHNDPDTIAAFIAEPVSTSAGIHFFAPESYWKGIRELTEKYNIVMIADEVITDLVGLESGLGLWYGMLCLI